MAGLSNSLSLSLTVYPSFFRLHLSPRIWHYVPTTANPADCASRRLMPLELLNHSLWWEGPSWLVDDPVPMPKQPPRKTPLEEPAVHVLHQHSSTAEEIGSLSSNYPITISVAAWCRRIWKRLKNGRPDPDHRTKKLSGAERIEAEQWLLREAQARAFPKERQLLQKGKPLPKTSRLRALNPILDQNLLLRVGGRLSNSALSKSQQQPVITDPRVTLTEAFTHTGMDFAGPFTIKLGHTRRPVRLEAHICVFICMTFKAVHLEVVSDQTTAAFKAALQRFISRRNCPTHLYSDNGSNFIGAKNDLHHLYKFLKRQEEDGDIQHFLLTHHYITWHNSPPRTPHFGGLWESAVKEMKKHLRRVIGSTLLTFEELTTIACQVEACMNSRPFLPLTSHTQDGLETLTASHFLLFKTPTSYPVDPRLPEKPHLLKKWNQCQAMVQHFWNRWSKEYLNSLQARTKWQTIKPNLQPEDIVIIRPERHLFSCHWPLGRILETFPGDDGLVRVVKIKTATGEYKRAVTRHSLLYRPKELQESSPQPLPPGVCPDSNPPLPGQPTDAAVQQPLLT